MTPDERRWAAALELIRAADCLRLLRQVAAARGEPEAFWVDESHLNAVRYARDRYDHHGDFRAIPARR